MTTRQFAQGVAANRVPPAQGAAAAGASAPIVESSATTKETGSGEPQNLAATVPSGAGTGDLLVAVICNKFSEAPSVIPSGWAEITLAGSRLFAYWIASPPSPPATYTWTFPNSSRAAINTTCIMARISGADTTTPIDAVGETLESSDTPTCADVTTTLDATLLLRIMGVPSGNTNVDTGEPAGTTLVKIDNAASGTGSAGLATEEQESAGATGTADYSISSVVPNAAATVAIAPAP